MKKAMKTTSKVFVNSEDVAHLEYILRNSHELRELNSEAISSSRRNWRGRGKPYGRGRELEIEHGIYHAHLLRDSAFEVDRAIRRVLPVSKVLEQYGSVIGGRMGIKSYYTDELIELAPTDFGDFVDFAD